MQKFPLTTPLDIILSYNAIFTSSLYSLYYNFSLFKMLIQCFFELFFILGRKLIYINLWRLKNFSIYYYYIHNVIIYIYIYKISRSNYIQPSLQTWRSATWSSNKLNDSCTVFEPIARFAYHNNLQSREQWPLSWTSS